MRNKRQSVLLTSFALLLLLSGCQKDERNSTDGQKFTIMATAASAVNTKTTLGDDLFVSWQQGDAIDIACSNTGNKIVEFTADAAGKTVPFSSADASISDFTGGDNEQYTFYGMYPAVNTYQWNGTEFRTMIPKNQVVTDGCSTKWDVKAAIAAGICKGEKPIMPFKNAHALVKVILPQWTVTDFQPISVMLMGRGDNDILAADYWVKPNESGLPTLTLIDNPNHVKTVALTKTEGYNPQETVYLVVPPGTAHGLHVFLSSTSRTSRISTTSDIVFEQNKIYTLDFSSTTIANFGDPVKCGPHVPPPGYYIIVATDGTVAYYQQKAQSGHPDTWQSEIFEIIDGEYTPFPIGNNSIRFVEVNNNPYQYAVALITSNNDLIGFLKYDLEWQGSRLLRVSGHHGGNIGPGDVPEGASIYTVYHNPDQPHS